METSSDEWQDVEGSFDLNVPVQMNPYDTVEGVVMFKVGKVSIPYTAIFQKVPKNGGAVEESM